MAASAIITASCRYRANTSARAELHVVGAAELFLREVHLEGRLQFLAIPAECAQELFIVGAALVPFLEQARRDVDAFAVPALRDHVDLLAGLARIRLLRLFGVAQVEVAGHAIREGVDPKPLAVGSDRDIDRQRDLGRIADRSDLPGLPLARC